MDLLLEGFLLGATLTVMIGPITFTIVDASLSSGVSRGIVSAVGMWSSDVLYIVVCYSGARRLQTFLQSEGTAQWIGIIGGLILLGIGIVIWFSRHRQGMQKQRHVFLHYSGYYLRGFLVNSFAPFTLFFWPTVTLTIVLPKATSVMHASGFYIGVLASIMIGDTLKAIFAAWVRRYISTKRLVQIRVILAAVFVIAGAIALGKVVWNIL